MSKYFLGIEKLQYQISEVIILFSGQVVEGENNIFVPKNGEWVDATTERFIYQVTWIKVELVNHISLVSMLLFTFSFKVRLRDSLFSTLKFSKAKDAQLAWPDGVIKMTDAERTDLKPLEEEGEELRSKPEIPMLNPLPEESVQVMISMTWLVRMDL